MTEHVYSTSDPTTVAAFKAAADAFRDGGRRAREDAEKLGKNKGALMISGPIGKPRLVGLEPDDPTDPPQGWQYIKSRERLEPRRGRAGDAARHWMDAHQPPDLRGVMGEHGLPAYYRRENIIGAPELFEHGGTLWALFKGEPQGSCSWEPRKLSEFYAAREAMESAEAALTTGVPA
ncbi:MULTISPECIES: hypothetical protein [unclassified Micromonospora]|uniref:hypothetical protein n=1 Tax=unclassified Micromonospora TaxID=2617518 RepID=UPI00332C9C32